jgi:cobalt-zinc-cadmium efflux system outer membrane protein
MPIAFAVLNGCASVSPHASFEDVAGQVKDRAGYRVLWYQGGTEDEEAKRAIERLLKEELTEASAVQIALLNNRRLQAVYQELGIAQAALVQAGLLKNPVFEAAVKFPISGGPTELDFTIVQEFLSLLFIPMRRAIAQADLEAAKLEVTGVVLDLVGETRAAFYGAQAAEQLLEMRQQVVQATAASYEAARRLHEAGNLRELDLHNERALHDQSKLDLATAESAVVETRERLNTLMGLWAEDTRWAMGHRLPDVPSEPLDLEGLERRAITTNIDLAAARSRLEAFESRPGLVKSTALIPAFEVGAHGEREEGDWEVGPVIALPIPFFDQGQARVAVANAEVRRQQEEYTARAVEIRAAVRATRQRVLAAQRTALFYRNELLPLRERIVRETLLQYNAMQIGVFQLLQAKEQQIEAGSRYIEALRAYWLLRTELDQALSGRFLSQNTDAALLRATVETGYRDQGGH